MLRISALFCCLLCVAHVAAAPPAETFAKQATFDAVKLSPDGKYLAITVPGADSGGLAVIDLDTLQIVSNTGMGRNRYVAGFWWVSDERIAVSPAERFGALDYLTRTGELLALDYTGKRQEYLVGFQVGGSTGSRIGRGRSELAAATMLNPLPNDPKHAIIGLDDFVGELQPERGTRIERISVKTGKRRSLGVSPYPLPSTVVTNSNGDAVLATTSDVTATKTISHWRRDAEDEWKRVSGLSGFVPEGVSADGQTGYVLATGSSGRNCLFSLSLIDGRHKELLCHPDASLNQVVFASDTGRPLAAIVEAGEPEWLYTDEEHEEQVLLRRFNSSFPDNQFVVPVSVSARGKRIVLLVYGDREPGVFYLFDQASKRIEQVAARREWVDPTQMARMKAFSFKARDGETIWGYRTEPSTKSDRRPPAVVMPHGGPIGVRDHWGWGRDAQFLASRGYAVIQVNFRGSAGYGGGFLDDGRNEWDGKMISDITDAVNWNIEAGHIDASRICAYGGSYGAYAAITSAIQEPQLYKCVIGYAGVYDVNLLRETSDISTSKRGLGYFLSSIAGSESEMRRLSPVSHLDKLRAPMLIVHGGEDLRTPVDQADALIAGLVARQHPFEYYNEPNEGHGFSDPEHVEEFLTRMERFLAKHIGD